MFTTIVVRLVAAVVLWGCLPACFELPSRHQPWLCHGIGEQDEIGGRNNMYHAWQWLSGFYFFRLIHTAQWRPVVVCDIQLTCANSSILRNVHLCFSGGNDLDGQAYCTCKIIQKCIVSRELMLQYLNLDPCPAHQKRDRRLEIKRMMSHNLGHKVGWKIWKSLKGCLWP